jgi:hypothetical protein
MQEDSFRLRHCSARQGLCQMSADVVVEKEMEKAEEGRKLCG